MSTLPLSSLTTSAVTTSAATATTQNPTTALLGQVSPALAKAHERLLAQSQTASASISQLGQYKATVSSLAGSAKELASVSGDTASAEVMSKVKRLVDAYNEALQQAKAGTEGRTGQAIAASRRALSSADSTRSQLTQLGLMRQPDGTLKLDTATLQKSLATNPAAAGSALSQLGKTLARRAESELADKGRLALAGTQSSAWAQGLTQQQGALVTAARKIAQGQASASSGASGPSADAAQVSASASPAASTSGSNWATRLALQRYGSAG